MKRIQKEIMYCSQCGKKRSVKKRARISKCKKCGNSLTVDNFNS